MSNQALNSILIRAREQYDTSYRHQSGEIEINAATIAYNYSELGDDTLRQILQEELTNPNFLKYLDRNLHNFGSLLKVVKKAVFDMIYLEVYNYAKNKADSLMKKCRCSNCGKIVESSVNLPFFCEYPNKEYNNYYCGCKGWD